MNVFDFYLSIYNFFHRGHSKKTAAITKSHLYLRSGGFQNKNSTFEVPTLYHNCTNHSPPTLLFVLLQN